MLQFSSSPITSRPRPPRSRSSQLSTSTGSGSGGGGASSPKTSSARARNTGRSKDASMMNLEAAALAVDTPPYTPEMLDVDLAAGRDVSEPPAGAARARTASELQLMLDEAHHIIQERERDLGIAASIGKSLLNNNIVLRAKQDALAQRVQLSPEKQTSRIPRSASGYLEHNIESRSKAQYVEARPPPSPRSSIGLTRSRGSVRFPASLEAAKEADWTDDEQDGLRSSVYGHSRSLRGSTSSSQFGASPRKGATPSKHNHRYSRSSSISSVRVTGPSAPNSITPSRSSPGQYLSQQAATPLQLQYQHAQLASQNAELERQLQELESELSQADVHGKKKLRRLDKELNSLRNELESALERNRDLEERLGRHGSSMSTSTSLTRVGDVGQIRNWTKRTQAEQPGHDDAWLADLLDRANIAQQPTDTDQDEAIADTDAELPVYQPVRPTLSKFASSPANLSRYLTGPAGNQEVDLVAQLLAKISELQRTNVEMAEQKAVAEMKLTDAEEESEELKRKYDLLEEKVLEVELRERSSPLRKKRESIEWHSPARSSVYGESPQRKALGNKPMIERHRRLSSLFDASKGSSPKAASPAAKRHPASLLTAESPSRPSAIQRSASASSRLSVSPSRGLRPGVSRSASNVSEFFEDDGWEQEQDVQARDEARTLDLLDSIRQRNTADLDLLRRSQHLLEQDESSSVGETSEDWRRMYDFKTSLSPSTSFDAISRQSISPLNSLKKIGHGQHTLASELGVLWTSDIKQDAEVLSDEKDVEDTAESAATVVLKSSVASSAPPSLALVTRDSGNRKLAKAGRRGDDEDDYRFLMGPGAPDAESYDQLQLALHDLPITWADDTAAFTPRLARKDIELRLEGASSEARSTDADLGWVYEDPEDSNSDNDPWKEEEESSSRAKTAVQLAVESRQAVEAREKADERAARRRRRLQELARELLRDDGEEEEECSDEEWEKKMRALRRVGSESSLEAMDKEALSAGQLVLHDSEHCAHEDRNEHTSSDGFELVSTTRRSGERGTDYWPVSLRARYAPAMVAMRVRATTQEYANLVLLWTRFLVVLAVAVAFSLWKGPRVALGLSDGKTSVRGGPGGRDSPGKSPKRVSRILDRPKHA